MVFFIFMNFNIHPKFCPELENSTSVKRALNLVLQCVLTLVLVSLVVVPPLSSWAVHSWHKQPQHLAVFAQELETNVHVCNLLVCNLLVESGYYCFHI